MLAPSTRATELLDGRRVIQGHAAAGERSSPSGRPFRSPAARRWACPSACARTSRSPSRGSVRRRPRLRARPALALLPRAAGHRRAHGRDVLLGRPARVPAGALAAREAARAHRRAARALRADRAGGGRALSRRLPRSCRPASTLDLFAPARSVEEITVELRPNERAGARACCASSASCPTGRRCCFGRRRSWRGRRSRATSPAASPCERRATERARAAILDETAIFVPGARRGCPRPARGTGRRLRDRLAAPASSRSRELAAAAAARLAEDDELRARGTGDARAPRPSSSRSTRSPEELEASTAG